MRFTTSTSVQVWVCGINTSRIDRIPFLRTWSIRFINLNIIFCAVYTRDFTVHYKAHHWSTNILVKATPCFKTAVCNLVCLSKWTSSYLLVYRLWIIGVLDYTEPAGSRHLCIHKNYSWLNVLIFQCFVFIIIYEWCFVFVLWFAVVLLYTCTGIFSFRLGCDELILLCTIWMMNSFPCFYFEIGFGSAKFGSQPRDIKGFYLLWDSVQLPTGSGSGHVTH